MKNFSIFKNDYKKEGSKLPDYKIMVSLKEGDQMIEAGGCWLKETKTGSKFFSCKLSDVYVDHTKGVARKGFELVEDPQTETAKTYKNETVDGATSEIPF